MDTGGLPENAVPVYGGRPTVGGGLMNGGIEGKTMRTIFMAAGSLSLCLPSLFASGDGSFQAPLTIPAGRPAGPVTVNWGDFNGDKKLDLVVATGAASNEATGTPAILVLFQNPTNRLVWTQVSLTVGTSAVYVRGADMDGDGFDDIMVGDVARSAFYVRSRGDGTFDPAKAISQANGARWIAIADFNNDGSLDFASSNFRASNLTVFLGDGQGRFGLSAQMAGHREHTLEAMDFDGDGFMDIMQGSGLPGITPFRGNGDGTFEVYPNVGNLGCIEYISEVGHYDREMNYVPTGDFNQDGYGDLAVTCIDDQTAYGGFSLGDGAYQRTFSASAGGGTESSAINDLNGDTLPDLAIVSAGDTRLWVYPGEGDGTFGPPEVFGPTGAGPVFLIAQDLDQDGFADVISADNQSYSLTVFWGSDSTRFLSSGTSITGYTGAKAMAVADVDRDGWADLIFPRSDQPAINVYKKPAVAAATRPSYSFPTAGKYSFLEVADFNRDGIADIAGAETAAGNALFALLDATGKVQSQQSLAAGIQPSAVELGYLDAGDPLDVAVSCKGSNHVALFFGRPGGDFAEPRILPTVEKPKAMAIGRIDEDFITDLVVIADKAVMVHYGTGDGEFAAPVTVANEASRIYTSVAAADLNGDSFSDIAVSETNTQSVQVFHGKGNRAFDPPVTLKVGAAPILLELIDINGDGRLDLSTSSTNARSISVVLSKGETEFAPFVVYGLGFGPTGHRIADLDRDGALDLIGFNSLNAIILFGNPDPTSAGEFRRGDPTGDGHIVLTDAVAIIFHLFGGLGPLPCADGGDADDNGTIEVTDAIAILNWLFAGGPAPAAPGPNVCGPDPSQDGLQCGGICL